VSGRCSQTDVASREAPVEATALGTGRIFVLVENGGTAALRVSIAIAFSYAEGGAHSLQPVAGPL
jgi:hypothetical protein